MKNQIKKMRCLICDKKLGLTKHINLNLIFCSKQCRDEHNKDMAYKNLEANEQLMVRSLT